MVSSTGIDPEFTTIKRASEAIGGSIIRYRTGTGELEEVIGKPMNGSRDKTVSVGPLSTNGSSNAYFEFIGEIPVASIRCGRARFSEQLGAIRFNQHGSVPTAKLQHLYLNILDSTADV